MSFRNHSVLFHVFISQDSFCLVLLVKPIFFAQFPLFRRSLLLLDFFLYSLAHLLHSSFLEIINANLDIVLYFLASDTQLNELPTKPSSYGNLICFYIFTYGKKNSIKSRYITNIVYVTLQHL